jgi:Na+/proline symporter
VQRYLTGETIRQSRLGLLFNGLVKVPMQFFILFVGAMVFVFYQFVAPPLSFNPVQREKVRASSYAAEFRQLEATHEQTFAAKRAAAMQLVAALDANDAAAAEQTATALQTLQKQDDATRKASLALIKKNDPLADKADTDYVFLTFIMGNLPPGLVGLLLAAIFCAAMSATASGLNSLASTSVIDIWKRLLLPGRADHEYVIVSKWMTVFWGAFCIAFALFANQLGSLIEAVNRVGSFFYGTMLAIFLVAFYAKRVGGTAMLWGALVAEIAVILCAMFTNMAWLWWNVVGCVVGVVAAMLFQLILPPQSPLPAVRGEG